MGDFTRAERRQSRPRRRLRCASEGDGSFFFFKKTAKEEGKQREPADISRGRERLGN